MFSTEGYLKAFYIPLMAGIPFIKIHLVAKHFSALPQRFLRRIFTVKSNVAEILTMGHGLAAEICACCSALPVYILSQPNAGHIFLHQVIHILLSIFLHNVAGTLLDIRYSAAAAAQTHRTGCFLSCL